MAKEEEKSDHISYRQSPIYSGRSWGPLLFITGACSLGHALIFTITNLFFSVLFSPFLPSSLKVFLPNTQTREVPQRRTLCDHKEVGANKCEELLVQQGQLHPPIESHLFLFYLTKQTASAVLGELRTYQRGLLSLISSPNSLPARVLAQELWTFRNHFCKISPGSKFNAKCGAIDSCT